MKQSWIETPMGKMTAVGDDDYLYLLEFETRNRLKEELYKLQQRGPITPGKSKTTSMIEEELQQYFAGKLAKFRTPIKQYGTVFQKQVWDELERIPKGETRSYLDMAKALNRPKSFRAVAQANGANQFALIIPCHRVINENGDLGGYGGGLEVKRQLLKLEQNS